MDPEPVYEAPPLHFKVVVASSQITKPGEFEIVLVNVVPLVISSGGKAVPS